MFALICLCIFLLFPHVHLDYGDADVMLHDASSKPEAFGSNVSELPAQKTCFVEDDSNLTAKHEPFDPFLQSVDDTTSSSGADFCSTSIVEQEINTDDQRRQRPLTVTSHSRDVAVFDSEDVMHSEQLSRRLEAAHSAEPMKLDISEHFTVECSETVSHVFPEQQCIDSADSNGERKLITQAVSETRGLITGDESKLEQNLSKKHVVPDEGDSTKVRSQEVEQQEPDKLKEQSLESIFVESVHTVEVPEESASVGTFAEEDMNMLQYAAACVPDTAETAEQSTVETCEEREEFLGAESDQQFEGDLAMTWKLMADDLTGRPDPDGEMLASAAQYYGSYSGQEDSMKHFMTEDVMFRTSFDFADTEIEYEYHRTDEDDDDTETVTSEEWCVLEKEHDVGLDITPVEDLTAPTRERMLADEDVSTLNREFLYGSSTDADATSTKFRSNATTCTSNAIYNHDHLTF